MCDRSSRANDGLPEASSIRPVLTGLPERERQKERWLSTCWFTICVCLCIWVNLHYIHSPPAYVCVCVYIDKRVFPLLMCVFRHLCTCSSPWHTPDFLFFIFFKQNNTSLQHTYTSMRTHTLPPKQAKTNEQAVKPLTVRALLWWPQYTISNTLKITQGKSLQPCPKASVPISVCDVWYACVSVTLCTSKHQIRWVSVTVLYYSWFANRSPQKTQADKYKPNKQQRKARLFVLIKGFIGEIWCQFFP